MPDITAADIGYALKLAPAEAVGFLRGKGLAVTEDWRELWQEAHTRAFTVAKMAKRDLLAKTREIIARKLAEGLSERQAAAELEGELRKAGWWGKRDADGAQLGSSRRIKTILRTNANTAYAAGRHRRQKESTATHPYWKYIAIRDGSTREAHRQLHGKILKHDDPAWEAIYPPNGFNCRCRVRALTAARAEAEMAAAPEVKLKGDAPQTRDVDLVSRRTGEVFTRKMTDVKLTDANGFERWFTPDAGWGYNPGAALRRPKPGMFADPNQRDWKEVGRPGVIQAVDDDPEVLSAADIDTAAKSLAALRSATGVTKGGNRRAATPDGVEDVIIYDEHLPHLFDGTDKSRARYANFLVPTLERPDEVWLVGYKNNKGDYEFRQHFIKAWKNKSTFTLGVESTDGQLFYTFFPARKRKDINKKRIGELLYFRDED